MLRSKPIMKYNGLTIVLSNPSRFDRLRLLSSTGGLLLDNHCLRPEYNSMQCDVRLKDEPSPFLEGTKCLLLLGNEAMWKYLPETKLNTINEIRGGLYKYKDIPTICSYLPQDAADIKDHESSNNPLAANYSPDDSVSSDDDGDEGDVKTLGKTKRSNYAFWLRADVRKCKKILGGNIHVIKQPKYIIAL